MSKDSISEHYAIPQHVLDVLSSCVVRAGHSLSWYHSKKGRVWITLRGFYPTLYTTSVEYDRSNPDMTIEQTFMVLLYRHWPKLTQQQPPLSTWDTSKATRDLYDVAEAWLTILVQEGIPLVDTFDPDTPV